MSQDLRTFLEKVQDETVYVDREVDPAYEINAYVDAYERARKYPVLFFRNAKGWKVVTNVFASIYRMGRALDCNGCDPPRIASRFFELSQKSIPPREVSSGEQTAVKDDLSSLPHIIHNELDGGPYIDSGLAILEDPGTGALNVGIYN
ncbi:MAG: UbiD family decarboxylase domain-containing protein [Nitrososphaeria archaeon]